MVNRVKFALVLEHKDLVFQATSRHRIPHSIIPDVYLCPCGIILRSIEGFASGLLSRATEPDLR